ncbi:MAG: hypothetical protein UR27_C0005G0002 [Candidatus Peregrinibacteria bacterium GW2011_GWA2_33_10]|nr:MAG: hypothetical protein UR27_C0005G0002 [Candidatus Peregrinibacteria bacterium GW2011_GWA2_33_10]KKP39260.1 MAG: hypothetical protein UR30_C0011G0003 [Candidatus Peregrinibacteria bacterium GW2011_GWC2_33_13]
MKDEFKKFSDGISEIVDPSEVNQFRALLDSILARLGQTQGCLEIGVATGSYQLAVDLLMRELIKAEEKVSDNREKIGEDYFDGPAVEIAEKMKRDGICIVSEIKGEKVVLKVKNAIPWHATKKEEGVSEIKMKKTYEKIAKQSGETLVPAGKLYTPWGRGRLLNVTTNDGCVWIEGVVPIEGVDGDIKGINKIAEALGIPSEGEEFNGLSVNNDQIYFVSRLLDKDLQK